MQKIDQLKELISVYWNIDSDAIDWETSFDSRSLKTFSSLRMLRFLAGVEERFQVTLEDPDAIRKFGDLRKAVQA